MNFSRRGKQELQFQLAPMIDVMFLLLCFFVSSQLFAQWETEIDLTLPTAQTGDVPQRMPGEVIINVHKDGRIVLQQRELSIDGLGQVLKRVSKLFPGRPVVIRGDEHADYRHLVKVMDQCRSADIYNISFATLIEE